MSGGDTSHGVGGAAGGGVAPGQGATGVQAQHQAELDAGRFLIQRCGSCGRHVYFPRELCPHCGSTVLAWVAPSGLGTVHAVTTVRRKPGDGGDLGVCLVDLDEGVRLMGRVENRPPEAVHIGLRVRARVTVKEGRGLVVFDAADESAPAPAPAPAAAPASASASASASTSTATQTRPLPRPRVVADPQRHLRGRAVIAGAATFGCGEAPGFTDLELLARAARAAVADAGLTMADIDGLATASASAVMWPLPVIEHLGLDPTYIDGTMLGGSSFVANLLPAMQALESGRCRAVLVCYGSAQRSATFGRREIVGLRRFLDPQPYEHPYEPALPVSAYALAASRHMHEFGTTREQLADVAVAARAWAALNPEAFVREPLTREQVLGARMVSDPLTVRDCCLVTDGAGAIVLVHRDRARDLPKPPVHVLGTATAVWARQISSMPELTATAARDSGARAFAMAGLAAKDVDVVALYDAFTINTILFLEDLGFCPKGEGGRFVADGGIAPGGRLPVNTNGGGLSCVHPGMYGIFTLVEAVRQLRGEAGARQVSGARVALAHGNGGMLSSQATAILGTADTV